MIELTLDNFEEMYRHYLSFKSREDIDVCAQDLVDKVREGAFMYQGKEVFTKIKSTTFDLEKEGSVLYQELYL